MGSLSSIGGDICGSVTSTMVQKTPHKAPVHGASSLTSYVDSPVDGGIASQYCGGLHRTSLSKYFGDTLREQIYFPHGVLVLELSIGALQTSMVLRTCQVRLNSPSSAPLLLSPPLFSTLLVLSRNKCSSLIQYPQSHTPFLSLEPSTMME